MREEKKNKVRVGIADAKVSRDASEVLVTYSLGSCLGVCLYDATMQIGGMVHCLLPHSPENPDQAKENPFKYADTGFSALLDKLISMGASKKRLKAKIAGGARTLKVAADSFDIGKRNYLAIRKVFWKHGMFISGEDVGGGAPRTMYLNIDDGLVAIGSRGDRKEL